MKLLSNQNGLLTFGTSTGATWSRPLLKSTQITMELHNWKSYRVLYEIDECTQNLFPEATHLIELSAFRSQEDPLFVAVSCHIKSGTKHQLIIYTDDDLPPTQVKIKKIHNWN